MELLAGVAIIPLILGLVEAAKGTFLKGRDEYAPWFAIVLGILFSVGYAVVGGTATASQLVQAGLFGIMFGLSASGLYAGPAKPVVTALKMNYAPRAMTQDTQTRAKFAPYAAMAASRKYDEEYPSHLDH